MTRWSIIVLAFIAFPVLAQDAQPVMYVTQYRVSAARLDSLESLVRTYDIPWHAAISEAVPGYQRWYYRHDTGGEYNFVVATLYPDWDMVRGDEIDYEAIWDRHRARMGYTEPQQEAMDDAFEWAYEGSSHVDNIYRPITGEE